MPSYANEIARASDALHKGRIDEADRLLSEILKSQPESAEAHHLRALMLLQRRDAAQALGHAQTAVELAPDDIRYRNNLGTTLMMAGQLDAALTHLDQVIAAAPDHRLARRNRGKLHAALDRFDEAVADLSAAVKHEPDRAETRVALANVLIDQGQFDDAAAALKAAEKIDGKQTANWRYVWGRLMYQMRRFADAIDAFTAALMADPSKMNHFIALAAAKFHRGDTREAAAVTRAAFQKFPFAERASGTPALRVLVLEAFGQDCFNEFPRGSFVYRRGNFTAHLPAGRVAYTHVISDRIDSLADVLDLGRFDVACNNVVIHETIEVRDQAEQLAHIVSELPMPLINAPQAVAQTTRVKNAERFADAERFIFPRTLRIDHALDPSPTKSQILDRLKLPIILRPLDTHVGFGATLVSDERTLEEEIAQRPFSEFYAIEYHDCQSDDGLFRRYRLDCVDGRLFTDSLHIARHWNAHGADRETLGWFDHGYDREELTYYDEPEQVLGAKPEVLFEEIVNNTTLDIYGVDFGRRQDGRFVVFEVNAAMALGLDVDYTAYPYRKPYADRLIREIEALFFARSGRKGTAPAERSAS